ncbi:hypothetical protein NFI96_005996 [Prochilodus magdalenae]|nr:hypothetical protein NFI96_005996 [Prochilodus magdalenae]
MTRCHSESLHDSLSCVVQPSADGAALTGGLMEDTTARWRSVMVVLGQSGPAPMFLLAWTQTSDALTVPGKLGVFGFCLVGDRKAKEASISEAGPASATSARSLRALPCPAPALALPPPRPALPCPALPCPALPCPCPALPCPALPCPALPCPALPRPCPALPGPALPLPCPCPALPCPALPCPAPPRPALPYQIRNRPGPARPGKTVPDPGPEVKPAGPS